jgi:glutamyl-tRNA synthetase
VRLLSLDDFVERSIPYCSGAGLFNDVPRPTERALLAAAAPLVQERVALLGEVPGMVAFLFTADDDLEIEADARASLGDDAAAVLDAGVAALEPLADFTVAAIEEALRVALIETLELKPRVAFGPLRVAISGRRVSPPLFESMELLGRESTLARLRALRASV